MSGDAGVHLNTSPTTDGMQTIAYAHRRFGMVGVLPTLITDTPQVQNRAIHAALTRRNHPGFLGFNIEGSHLSLSHRCSHAARYLRMLDNRTIKVVTRLRLAGIAVMITLAPKAAAPGQIARPVETCAMVSIGHSDTTAQRVCASLAEEPTSFTNSCNTMSSTLGRAPDVCINSTTYAAVICDGTDVADHAVALALRARLQPDSNFLSSVAMPTVGRPDHFSQYGDEIRLVAIRLVIAERARARAPLIMAVSVARLSPVLGVASETAQRIPTRVIGWNAGFTGQRVEEAALPSVTWSVTSVALSLP
ncbi:MAG: N-acetylglucosamine-6-phosphate deacetylase [Cypionkella sp.]